MEETQFDENLRTFDYTRELFAEIVLLMPLIVIKAKSCDRQSKSRKQENEGRKKRRQKNSDGPVIQNSYKKSDGRFVNTLTVKTHKT